MWYLCSSLLCCWRVFSAGKWHWVKIFALMVKGQAVMKMGTIGSTETSAINHQPILRNVTEELKPHFRRGGKQKSWHCVDGQVSVFRRNVVHSSSPWRWPHSVLRNRRTTGPQTASHSRRSESSAVIIPEYNSQGRKIGGPITRTVFINALCTGNEYFHTFRPRKNFTLFSPFILDSVPLGSFTLFGLQFFFKFLTIFLTPLNLFVNQPTKAQL